MHPWVKPNSGELRQSVGGTFGRLALFSTATSQEPRNCTHLKAHNFKKEWEGGMMQIGV